MGPAGIQGPPGPPGIAVYNPEEAKFLAGGLDITGGELTISTRKLVSRPNFRFAINYFSS